MFGFSGSIESEVHAALFEDSMLGIAVIARDHKIVATNAEMDRINGFNHPGEPIDAKSLMPEVTEEAQEHVDAVFYSGEPVFNAIVRGPYKDEGRKTYVCDYVPTPRSGEVKYVISIVRPLRVARRTGNPLLEAAERLDTPLP